MAVAIALPFILACERRVDAPALPPATGGSSSPRPDTDPDPVADASPPPPELLARDEGIPRALRLDDTHVFWGTQATGDCCAEVRAVPKTGGKPVTVFAAPRQLNVEGAVSYAARVLELLVDRDWIFVRIAENQTVPRNDGPVFHRSETSWRVSRHDGRVDVFPPEGAVDLGFEGPSSFSPEAEDLYFLKQAEAASQYRDFFVAATSKATAVTKIATFHSDDPLMVTNWAVDGGTLYLSYDSLNGGADPYCLARAPIAGGRLEKVWCPRFPIGHIIPGTDRLFLTKYWSPAEVWTVDKHTGFAQAVAASSGNTLFLAGADDRAGVIFGVEVFYSSNGPGLSSNLFQVDVASGARGTIDRADAPDGYANPALSPHTAVQFDEDRVYFTRGTGVYARKR